MFSSFRDSLKAHTPTRPPLLKIRSSAQSFFAPDRHVQLHDEPLTPGPTFLSRNRTERNRLQGLVSSRMMSVYDPDEDGVKKARGLVEKAKVWMVNDGQLRIARNAGPQ